MATGYKKQSPHLEGYTTQEIDAMIAGIEHPPPSPHLDGYTKAEIDEKFTQITHPTISQEISGNREQGHIVNGVIRQDWFTVNESTDGATNYDGHIWSKAFTIYIPSEIAEQYEGDYYKVNVRIDDSPIGLSERISFRVDNKRQITVWADWYRKNETNKNEPFNMLVELTGRKKQ